MNGLLYVKDLRHAKRLRELARNDYARFEQLAHRYRRHPKLGPFYRKAQHEAGWVEDMAKMYISEWHRATYWATEGIRAFTLSRLFSPAQFPNTVQLGVTPWQVYASKMDPQVLAYLQDEWRRTH